MTFKRCPIKFITKDRSSYEQFKVGDTAYYLTPSRNIIHKSTITKIIENRCILSERADFKFKLANGEEKEYDELFDSAGKALAELIDRLKGDIEGNKYEVQRLQRAINRQKRKLSQLEAIEKNAAARKK